MLVGIGRTGLRALGGNGSGRLTPPFFSAAVATVASRRTDSSRSLPKEEGHHWFYGPSAPLAYIRHGCGKILAGNLVSLLKRKFPILRKLFTLSANKMDTTFNTVADEYPHVENLDELFEKKLDTGDILLRHTNSFVGIATQLVDNSWWDHVAVIVRQRGERTKSIPMPPVPPWAPEDFAWEPFHDGQLQLFEANQMGCWVYPFEQFMRLFKQKHKTMLLRHLVPISPEECERRQEEGELLTHDSQGVGENMLTDVQREYMEAFIQEIQGAPYEKRIVLELLQVACSAPPDIDAIAEKSVESLESVFCSELVAEAYQRMRLIPEKLLNSNEVMPSAFSTDISVFDRLMRHPEMHEIIRDGKQVHMVLGKEQVLRWEDIRQYYARKRDSLEWRIESSARHDEA
jgi:hypothetical protein